MRSEQALNSSGSWFLTRRGSTDVKCDGWNVGLKNSSPAALPGPLTFLSLGGSLESVYVGG